MSDNNNNPENIEEEEKTNEEVGNELIEQTNNILENINHNFRRRARERLLSNDLDIRNRLSRNTNNLDNFLRSRINLREQLEATRCNYLINPERFCSRMKTNNSDYCIYHQSMTTLNNTRLTSQRLLERPPRGRPHRNIYSIEDIRNDIESQRQRQPVFIGVSSSNISFGVTSSNIDDNVSIGITNNIGVTDNNIVHHWVQNNDDVSLGVTTNSTDVPELNLFNLITRHGRRNGRTFDFLNREFISRPRDNLAELKEQKDKNGKCPLCQKTVYSPFVMLDCNHKFHLNCFIILNTDEDNKYELMEECLKCGEKINMNLKEENDCSICLEKLIDDDIEIELPCKHRFHVYCIQRWVDINKNCPLCRKTF